MPIHCWNGRLNDKWREVNAPRQAPQQGLMNTRSRSAGPCDVLHIPRNAIKSKTSKSSVSHLARAQNFKTNCRLFTFNNVYFKSSTFKYPIEKKINKRKIKNKKAHTVSVNIAAWNIRSLNYSREEDYSTLKCTPNDKRPLLVKEAKRLHLDVLSLSETRLLGQDNLEINGYLLVWSGQEDIHQSGVALLLKQEHTREKMEIECISDRIIKVTIKIKGQICTIIGVYAPTNTHDIETKIGFYSLLDKTIQSVSKKHTLFVCGDFNARVGRSRKDENQWHGILGNYGSGQSNENGLLLLETCTTHNLRICNTFFKRKLRGTWQHPRSKKWHQLDHILCQKKTVITTSFV